MLSSYSSRDGSSKEERSYAKVTAAIPAQMPSQPWTKVSYKNQKNKTPPTIKAEQHRRRILFSRKSGSQLKSKADLMLALNKALQKARVEPKV